MSNDITLKPSFKSNREEFEQYIEDIEVNFKTSKGSFIGTFNTWNIIINLNSNIEVPENIKFNFFIDGIMHKTPTFQLTPTVNDETQEEIVIKGHDKSILFDTPFEWTQTLPCTIGQLAQNICNKVGIPIKDINFINSDFVIYRQIADNKKTNREVIAMISAIAAGNAFINEDDELEIRSFIETNTEIEEYFESEKFIKVGPITGVNLAREPIKQYEEKNDDYLASQNKKIVVKITNNLIVDDNRELALPAIYNKLHGLEFYCKKIETYEAYFIKPFSFINSNNNKVLVDTICLKYPSLLDSYISSNNLDEISSNSKSKSLRQRIINAEAKVDEVEGKIVLLTEEVTDYENKVTEIEQTVDSINQKVENSIDITREATGTKLQLENCMEGDLLELHIYGNNTVFDRLKLGNNTILGNNTKLRGDSLIEVYQDLKSKFQKKFGYRYINFFYWYNASNTVTKYQAFARKTQNYNRYYIMELEEGKKYNIKIEPNDISETKWLYLATFSEDPFENENDEDIIAINYYGIRRERYNDETSQFESFTNTDENFIQFTATKEEKYLIFYSYAVSTFETAKIYTNYQSLELGVSEVLRQKEEIFDEYILSNNTAKIIRRIGVLENGETYILPNEQIENLGEFSIHVAKGNNTIKIKNYTANMMADYVIINEFTSKFATTVELYSVITQLANQIKLEVSKKVGNDEIFARINMAVLGIDDAEIPEDIEKSIIEFIANKIAIKSDNFELTKEGVIKAIEGLIAGLRMTTNENGDSYLYKNYQVGDKTYQSGLFIPKTGSGEEAFLYAGVEVTYGSTSLKNANTVVTHDGKIILKTTSGSSNNKNNLTGGFLKIVDSTADVETVIGSSLIDTYYVIAGSGGKKGYCMHGYDTEHDYWCNWTGEWFTFYADGELVANATTRSSDERLKEDIGYVPDKLIELIDSLEIKKFKIKNMNNIRFGIIAQDLLKKAQELKIDDIFDYQIIDRQKVHLEDETLYYLIDYEQFLILKNKSLENKLKKQQNTIDFLINKFNLNKELNEYLKGEKIWL